MGKIILMFYSLFYTIVCSTIILVYKVDFKTNFIKGENMPFKYLPNSSPPY